MTTRTRRHARYPYSALPERPVFAWPNGRRLAVYVALNVETFSFGEGEGAGLAPKQAEPDVLNHAWREWGNRVGVWRMKDVFDALDLPLALLPNACVYENCPGLIEAFRARGDEIVAHGRTNAERQGTLSEAEERALIGEASDIFRRHEGGLPAGWLAPWISQSEVSIDLLKEAGYAYHLDWCHDDQPTWMATRDGGRILSVPYSHEINDIPAISARFTGPEAFADMIIAQFDEMLEASSKAPAVMSIALHPYITGQPYRLRALKRALSHIAAHRDRIWLTRPGEIAKAFAERG
ncbi:polysaccharide deacetylase family protein [Fulvimarina sp. 2208YS6-2-32]|uniref:Polysaccharide deacetylase family protein n=1 Tax=Fulvimarina uroteuthidis TaxID=3098149 RepID=A0ABU5I847_9HYPH|nr:polysaccharide deacetylase family protein [Fulvimarina sp. 2208YS6-2-32]MDY8111108.1 polysaccharide deacetylase family protein [Fulvimarina sp. 2208YS6-2-32]